MVNAPLNVKDLEIKYLNLEQQGDSVVVAVENKVRKKTLLLSKNNANASDYYKPKGYETYFEIEEMISIAPN